MTRINILTVKESRRIGAINGDFFPLIKWSKEFKAEGIHFKFFLNHFNKNIYNCEVLILDYRYFEQIRKGNVRVKGVKKGQDERFIIDFIQHLNKNQVKVILFDSADGAGTRCGPIIPYVDLVLKKQMFKNLNWYLGIDQRHQVQVWLPDSIDPLQSDWKGNLRKEDLNKLKIGWNIGIRDTKKFPMFLSKYFPVHQQWLGTLFSNKENFTNPSKDRKIFLAHRGAGPKGKHERYDYSRRILYRKLEKLNCSDIIIGGRVDKNTYLKELENAKVTISPFGHGEVCHRDFEAIMSGSLLIKPSMEHLTTWPDIYKPYETYVPVKWDYSDLEEKLVDIKENYERYLNTVYNAQQILKQAISNHERFIFRFRETISNLISLKE